MSIGPSFSVVSFTTRSTSAGLPTSAAMAMVFLPMALAARSVSAPRACRRDDLMPFGGVALRDARRSCRRYR